METILQDDALLLHRPTPVVERAMAQIGELGIDRVRITANWSLVAPNADSRQRPDFDATDPDAYPAHRWDNLDRAVRLAAANGLAVNIDIAFWAPLWATSDTSPGQARSNVDAGDFARFATAVARRYSGGYAPKDETGIPPAPPSRDADFLESLLGGGSSQPPPSSDPSDPSGPVPVLPLPNLPRSRARSAPRAAPVPDRRQDRLPAVRLYTLWNEPNDPIFLSPQWAPGRRPVPRSADVYRPLVYAGYAAVKGVSGDNRVLVGGTAASGSDGTAGTGGTAPLRFLRRLACVDERLRPLRDAECASFRQLPGDGWAHHPYSLGKRPDVPTRGPDNVTISELQRLTGLLDKLVRRGRLSSALRDVWLTEFGYESNYPVRSKPFTPHQQARFLVWSEYLAWRNPRVRSFAQFLLRDLDTAQALSHTGPGRVLGSWQSGLFLEDGAPKPAAEAYRNFFWAQYLRPARPARTARRRPAPRARRPRTVTLWGHLRGVSGPTRVRVLARARGRVAWRAARAAGRRGGVTVTDAKGYFLLRVPFEPAARYQLQRLGPRGWDTGPVIAPQASALG